MDPGVGAVADTDGGSVRLPPVAFLFRPRCVVRHDVVEVEPDQVAARECEACGLRIEGERRVTFVRMLRADFVSLSHTRQQYQAPAQVAGAQ